MTTANIVPTAPTDGIVYASAVPLTPTEAALGDALQVPAVIPVEWGQTVVAVVKFSLNGHIVTNASMVFLQTDLGDGTWVDVAWALWTGSDAEATFVLCAGGVGAMNNAFQQLRKASGFPAAAANGSNACPLGGRVRFTGFSKFVGGSSSLAGVVTAVTVTITYKIQNPR